MSGRHGRVVVWVTWRWSNRDGVSRGEVEVSPVMGVADRICLTGLRVFAHHGGFAPERRAGKGFVFDVWGWVVLRAGAGGGSFFFPARHKYDGHRAQTTRPDNRPVCRCRGDDCANTMSPTEMVRAVVAFGTNLGDRDATITSALRAVADAPQVELIGISPIYQTPALTLEGIDADAPPYLNGVVTVRTTLSADALL